jgi:tetratricopeptide (TPR) repeat protein
MLLNLPDLALEDLNRAEQLQPNLESQFYINRAQTYELKNDFERAKQDYIKAAQVDPQDPQGEGGFGELLLKSGKPQEALQHIDRAVRVNESIAYWLMLRSQCYDLLSNHVAAVKDAEAAIMAAEKSGDPSYALYQEHLTRLNSQSAHQ